MYKSSFYNLIIPVPETNEMLIYNTFHGGVIVLNSSEERVVSYLKGLEKFKLSENTSEYSLLMMLVEKEYIVESTVDEIKEYKKRKREKLEAMYARTEASIGLTIGASSLCNMACPYCYELKKPDFEWDDTSMNNLEKYLESMIAQSTQIKKWNELGVVWYGGEPLLGLSTIKKCTPKLISLAKKNSMTYYARIITNGILLTQDVWNVLEENQVNRLQITIDGIKEIHNKHRPLRNLNEKNYERILENLGHIPEGMKVMIRVNTDYEIVDRFDEFLDDLEAYRIWPQKHKQVRIMPCLLRTYEQVTENNLSRRISKNKWELVRMELSYRILKRFNRWADQNNKKRAKFIFKFPRPRFDECISLISPYVLTIGADGYTYKCWEYIHVEESRVQALGEKYQMNKYADYLKFSKEKRCPRSSRCKFFPICEATTCLARNEKADCLWEEGDFLQELKNKYLQYRQIDESL